MRKPTNQRSRRIPHRQAFVDVGAVGVTHVREPDLRSFTLSFISLLRIPRHDARRPVQHPLLRPRHPEAEAEKAVMGGHSLPHGHVRLRPVVVFSRNWR